MSEYWNLYDKNRKKLTKIVKRGDNLNDNEYHLVINAWIKNKNNEFLITQRSKNKKHPLMWECTGGSAIEGEDSIDAARREIKEELGIEINTKTAKYYGATLRYYPNCPDILDVWLFEDNTNIKNVKIQEEEVNDAMWATKEKIMELYKNGQFEANAYFLEIINDVER